MDKKVRYVLEARPWGSGEEAPGPWERRFQSMSRELAFDAITGHIAGSAFVRIRNEATGALECHVDCQYRVEPYGPVVVLPPEAAPRPGFH
jgi:hypothetical protein